MDTLGLLADGLATAMSPTNLLYVFLGCLVGTMIGLLPGVGPATGVALLIPLTFGLEPVTALIMLAGLYYGSQYGGTISSVLLNTPGEASSVMTALDGYQMARAGRAGAALAIAAIGSFVAGIISLLLLSFTAVPLARFGVKFGPPENLALVIFALLAISGFSQGARVKGVVMGALGILISTVGLDSVTGTSRFTFGSIDLLVGIGFLPVIIGVFAIAEIMRQANEGYSEPLHASFRELTITRSEWRRSRVPIVRGSVIGFLTGCLPGGGATLASFLAYDVERRRSKTPERFGKGAIEGVAAAESANNSAAQGSFVPTLTLGIPGSGTTAVLLGAFVLYGLQPGPRLFEDQPDLVWGLLASFFVGNVILLIMNLPLAPVFAMMLRIRYLYVYPLVLVIALVGTFATSNIYGDVYIAVALGAIGFVLTLLSYPLAPLVLGVVLGSLLEKNLVQTSEIVDSPIDLVSRPITVTIVLATIAVVIGPLVARVVRGRRDNPDDHQGPSTGEPSESSGFPTGGNGFGPETAAGVAPKSTPKNPPGD